MQRPDEASSSAPWMSVQGGNVAVWRQTSVRATGSVAEWKMERPILTGSQYIKTWTTQSPTALSVCHLQLFSISLQTARDIESKMRSETRLKLFTLDPDTQVAEQLP